MSTPNDFKISTAEKNAVHVEAQPTILQGSPQQNKHAFDAYPDLLTERHNGLCDLLETSLSPTIDNSTILLYEQLGWTPEN